MPETAAHTPQLRLNPMFEASPSTGSRTSSVAATPVAAHQPLAAAAGGEEAQQATPEAAESRFSEMSMPAWADAGTPGSFGSTPAGGSPELAGPAGKVLDADNRRSPSPWFTYFSEAYRSPPAVDPGDVELDVDADSLTLELSKLLADFQQVGGAWQ